VQEQVLSLTQLQALCQTPSSIPLPWTRKACLSATAIGCQGKLIASDTRRPRKPIKRTHSKSLSW
ncbi:29690_t:CDS:1, partial [Racocetra persica]